MFGMIFFGLLTVAVLANLAGGLLFGKIWNRNRFAYRGEFSLSGLIFSHVLMLAALAFMIWSAAGRASSGQ